MHDLVLSFLDEQQAKSAAKEALRPSRDVNLAPITEDDELAASGANDARTSYLRQQQQQQQQEDDEVGTKETSTRNNYSTSTRRTTKIDAETTVVMTTTEKTKTIMKTRTMTVMKATAFVGLAPAVEVLNGRVVVAERMKNVLILMKMKRLASTRSRTKPMPQNDPKSSVKKTQISWKHSMHSWQTLWQWVSMWTRLWRAERSSFSIATLERHDQSTATGYLRSRSLTKTESTNHARCKQSFTYAFDYSSTSSFQSWLLLDPFQIAMVMMKAKVRRRNPIPSISWSCWRRTTSLRYVPHKRLDISDMSLQFYDMAVSSTSEMALRLKAREQVSDNTSASDASSTVVFRLIVRRRLDWRFSPWICQHVWNKKMNKVCLLITHLRLSSEIPCLGWS